jgi:hypothetical protein
VPGKNIPKIDRQTAEDFRIPVILSSLYSLQKKLLQHICSVDNATYKTLMKHTDRDRITILQSLKPLVKFQYIEEKRLDPKSEKSKSIFSPTSKGFSYAWALGLVNTKDITKIKKYDTIINYVKFIDEVFAPSQHKEMLGLLFTELANGRLDYEENNENKEKDLVKESFRNALFELIQKENYDSQFLSNRRTLEWLTKLYSITELRMIKRRFTQVKNNLDDTIKRLPG